MPNKAISCCGSTGSQGKSTWLPGYRLSQVCSFSSALPFEGNVNPKAGGHSTSDTLGYSSSLLRGLPSW